MKLKSIVSPKAIITSLDASQRDEVITELVDALIDSGATEASLREELIEKVLEREQKGSTGFGRGVAVPHVKHASVTSIHAAIGLSQAGVEFNALDRQPVFSIFLLLSPADSPEEHLQAMEVIFKNLSQETFRKFLRQADSADEVLTLLEEADSHQYTG